jgi:hypothetical protein
MYSKLLLNLTSPASIFKSFFEYLRAMASAGDAEDAVARLWASETQDLNRL